MAPIIVPGGSDHPESRSFTRQLEVRATRRCASLTRPLGKGARHGLIPSN